MIKPAFRLLAASLAWALLGGAASALDFGLGPRLGLSRSPNAIEVGAQFLISDLGIDLVEPLRLEASADWSSGKTDLDLESGVSFTSWQFNGNFQYVLLRPTRLWQIYPLLGVGIRRLEIEGQHSTATGLNLGGGILSGPFAAHATLGLGDLPTLTITVSYALGF